MPNNISRVTTTRGRHLYGKLGNRDGIDKTEMVRAAIVPAAQKTEMEAFETEMVPV